MKTWKSSSHCFESHTSCFCNAAAYLYIEISWETNDFHGQSNKENTFIQINPSLHKDRFQKRVADPDSNEETSQVLVFHK